MHQSAPRIIGLLLLIFIAFVLNHADGRIIRQLYLSGVRKVAYEIPTKLKLIVANHNSIKSGWYEPFSLTPKEFQGLASTLCVERAKWLTCRASTLRQIDIVLKPSTLMLVDQAKIVSWPEPVGARLALFLGNTITRGHNSKRL